MKKPPLILHILFTIYGWIFCFIFLMLLSLSCMLLRLFFSYSFCYPWFRSFGWVMRILFSSVKIDYHPDYDPNTPYVLMQNHVNILDAFIASHVSHNTLAGLMHRWQFFIPFYGWLMFLSKGIPVDPKKRDNLARITDIAKQRHHEGISIVAYPEGGRTITGHCKPFKKGVFVMAWQAGYPIVPVATRGNYKINQKSSKRLWPHPVDVYVGKPRPTKDLTRQDLQTLIDDVEYEINQFVEYGTKPEVGSTA